MRKEDVVVSLLVGAAALIVGCSGGQQAGVSPSGNSAPVTQKGMGTATFTLSIPSASTSALGRVPAYISAGTQSISIAVNSGTPTTANLTPGSPNCSTGGSGLQCSLTVAAPIGNDTFAISLYSGTNGSGSVLSSATIAGTVAAAAANLFPITFNGTVAAISISVTNGNNLIPGGYATTLPVVVTAQDASGNIIVGPGDYANPITLSNADTSGSSVLSTATVNAPSTNVTLSYCPTAAQSAAAGCVINVNGLPVGATTIGASASGVAGANVTPGTFQYIADTFYGYNHVRIMYGTGTVTTTTYNGAGAPSPNPSTWSYNITEASQGIPGQTFNGVSGLGDTQIVYSYTQTSPVTSASPEVEAFDQYRGNVLNATGAIRYQYGRTIADVNSGTINSPISGFPPGTTTLTDYYPTSGTLFEENPLPFTTTSWSDSAVPYTVTDTGAEVGTQSFPGDGSFSQSFSIPPGSQSQTAAGAGVNFNGSNGFTNTYGIPIPAPTGTGYVIPYVHQQTSPSPGPTQSAEATDWYPGGGLPIQPLITNTWTLTFGGLPASCNVPASIATQAWDSADTTTFLRVPSANYEQQVNSNYFVVGIGAVCQVFTSTTTTYNPTTGIISAQTVLQYSAGVTSTNDLSVARKP